MKDLKELWKTALAQIEVKLDSVTEFKIWLEDTTLLDINNKEAIIGVKNSYACDWLKKRHDKIIRDTLTYLYGNNVQIKYKVDPKLANIKKPKQNKNSKENIPTLFGIKNGITTDTRQLLTKAGLNPNYSFASFVNGNSNKIAVAAAKAVSQKPGDSYNPLFIQGKTGLGKTHLAQAIGREVIEKFSKKKVIYTTSEGFLNDMVKSIRENKSIEFRSKYRSVDVLIIDDIQLISKWVETQNEFFNTYNELYNSGKQIILISDRTPDRLDGLEPRLKSRFKGGVVVEILPPDFEMRMAILEKKSEEMGIDLPKEITEFIAKEIKDNIRELEGALKKVSLYNSLSENELTIEEVARIIGRDVKSKREKIKPKQIIKIVAKEFDLNLSDITGSSRKADIALARQVCMYIMRQELKFKLEKIASILNRKDHTTVIHAVDKIESKIKLDEGFKVIIDNIYSKLEE